VPERLSSTGSAMAMSWAEATPWVAAVSWAVMLWVVMM
jgi:hypothetical protein